MAQYGGEQYGLKEGHHDAVEEHAHNPLQSAVVGHDNSEGTKINTIGTGAAGHVNHQRGQHNVASAGAGGILHHSGSGNSSSSEDDGEGGRRRKEGVVEKIKVVLLVAMSTRIQPRPPLEVGMRGQRKGMRRRD